TEDEPGVEDTRPETGEDERERDGEGVALVDESQPTTDEDGSDAPEPPAAAGEEPAGAPSVTGSPAATTTAAAAASGSGSVSEPAEVTTGVMVAPRPTAGSDRDQVDLSALTGWLRRRNLLGQPHPRRPPTPTFADPGGESSNGAGAGAGADAIDEATPAL